MQFKGTKILEFSKLIFFFKLNRYADVVKDCSLVLAVQPDNVKALVRRGNAYLNQSDFELAQDDLKKALELNPDDSVIKKLLQDLKLRKIALKEREKKVFKNMFS